MYDEIIKAQKDNSLTINYNKWISDIISPYLGSRIMDVGGGMGNFLQYILDKESVVVVDVLDVFIENLHKLSCLHKNVHVFGCDIQDPSIVKIGNRYSIDSVICNNVLEHVQDDLTALRNINTILKNRNGKLILILPAFSFLYSNWDKSVGHFRRYDYGEIKHKLKATGFLVENYFYINIVGFFGWFINGKILRNTPAKSRSIEWQAVFFDKYIVNVLRRLEKMFRPPFGQSLIMVVRPI